MNKILFLICVLALGACSKGRYSETFPELHSYSEEQNYVLERMQWLGFDPSILRTQQLKDGLSVIFGYGGYALV